jgi:hypothetical protein
MGCIFSSQDVQTRKYATGGDVGNDSHREALDAVALVTGSDAFSSWVEVQVACKNLRTADTFSWVQGHHRMATCTMHEAQGMGHDRMGQAGRMGHGRMDMMHGRMAAWPHGGT